MSGIIGIRHLSIDFHVADPRSVVDFPKEILALISRHLKTAKNVVHFGMASHHLYSLISMDPMVAQLWKSFLRKDFPDSYTNLKSSHTFKSEIDNVFFENYNRLAIAEHNIKAGKYHLQMFNDYRNQDDMNSIAVCNNKLICYGFKDIEIWDLGRLEKLWTLKGHQDRVNCVITCQGKLISGSNDTTIKIWDLESGKELRTLNGHKDRVNCIAAYNGMLISGSDDKTIKICDLENGRELRTLNEHQAAIKSIAVSHGKLISGSDDRTIKIWDLESGNILQSLDGSQYQFDVDIAAYDNQLILYSWTEKKIKIWDLKNCCEIKSPNEHQDSISYMAVYDGKLFSYSMDGTIKIGDLKSSQELLTLNLGYETNSCFAFCNGKLIVGLPSMIKIWDFNPVLKENHNL